MTKLFLLLMLTIAVGAGCTLTNDGSDTSNGDTTPPVSKAETETLTTSKTVDLSQQNLTALPASVLTNPNIEILNISSNQITGALPAEIRKLTKLVTLNASNNQFRGIPAEIGQLQKLEVIDFSNNQLTGIPLELGNLKALKILDLSGNNISTTDIATIRKNLPAGVEIRL